MRYSREWLETNGIGGFASSTIVGMNTRRYHGLLTAATKPPVGPRGAARRNSRRRLIVGGERYDLAATAIPAPCIRKASISAGVPLDHSRCSSIEVEGVESRSASSWCMARTPSSIEYAMRQGRDCDSGNASADRLPRLPLHYARNDALNPTVVEEDKASRLCAIRGNAALSFRAQRAARDRATGDWYRNFEYDRERERGLDFQEDLFNPWCSRSRCGRGQTVTFDRSAQLGTREPPMRAVARSPPQTGRSRGSAPIRLS